MDAKAAIAAIRFGLGRRAGEPVPADARGWLAGQLDGADVALARPGASATDGLAAIRAAMQAKDQPNQRQPIRELFAAGSAAAIDQLLTTEQPFRERLAWFWANHFTVSLRQGNVAALAHAYLREAIRPHVTGRFADMLRAVMRHPAMLIYLNNAQSVGPNSPAGQRRKLGLNENLARECLELHTITPASGYSQADVTSFARVITGWTTAAEAPGGFIFRPAMHEPGVHTVMGRAWPAGEQGGLQALDWLAAHPATRRHLATKLARHFVADAPPPAVVARIEAVLQRTDGDLKAAALAVLDSAEAWQRLGKLRSPFDYTVAVLRALDLPAERRPPVVGIMNGLGQPMFNCPAPNGWPDTAADWAGPEAMMRRVDWAWSVSSGGARHDPVALADDTLGPLLPAETRARIARAGSKREALTMLFASPEFMRR